MENIMAVPIALQLYSVRENLTEDFMKTMQQIADIGFTAIETVSFPGVTAEKAGEIFRELNLRVCGAHSVLPVGGDKNNVLDTMAAIGCKRIVHSLLTVDSIDEIKNICDVVNQACQIAADNDMTITLHNHWWEFEPVQERLPFDLIRQWVDPAVSFEIDPYWIITANRDPIQIIKSLGSKLSILHINDGPGTKDEPMVPVGSGEIDVAAIVKSAEDFPEWLVVDLSMLAADEIESAKKSYRYLISSGLCSA